MFLAANPLYEAFVQSDFFGKLIFLGLIVLSVMSWVVILYKGWLLRRAEELARAFQKAFLLVQQSPLSLDIGVFSSSREVPHPFLAAYEVLKAQALAVLNKNRLYGTGDDDSPAYLSPADITLVDAHVTASVSSQINFLERNVFLLSMTVSLAPFLGLLGTVWGILVTFAELQHGTAQGNETVLGGLSMALGTTVIGLVVAIPALIGYSYLRMRIRQFTIDMEDFSNTMLAAVEIQYRKVDV